ncbi:MAG: alanine--tRNA ligase [Candidatus Micrarchaeia archaeon]
MLEGIKLDKKELRKEFSKHPDVYYLTKVFKENNFERYTCKICGKNFWSTQKRDTCEDPEHTEYSFFKNKPTPISYVDMWKKFSKFFEENGHTTIKRYPVVSRWRQDLYFTIASIQDFQRIENGSMNFEYNANPLIVPQICLRFGDIENVGITGRHMTSFMMAGQHAFNYPKEGYWRDRTIELDYKFLTNILGVKKEDLIYNEDVWAMGDFSEFGPCLEGFSNGLELVNNVFTQFESTNNKIKELSSQVVDVGWGFERLLWFYTGFDNVYEAVFHDIIEKTKRKLPFEMDTQLFRRFAKYASELDVTETSEYQKLETNILKKAEITKEQYLKEIKPMQAFYAILDHTRTLLFGISDGALPSNIGGGYNLRVILRRAIAFIKEYEMDITITDIAKRQANELKELYPELEENLDILNKVVDVEYKRYETSVANSGKIITNMLSKKSKITKEELRVLYESNGVTPELINSVAQAENKKIELPDGAYEDIIKGDFAAKEKTSKIDFEVPEGIEKTQQLYYEFKTESHSKILFSKGKYIILDKTPFYPEGGGQAADHGTIDDLEVYDVQKVGNVIVHILKDESKNHLKKENAAICKVDLNRRRKLMAHHTATHLISAAARKILGKHAWQEGAKKEENKAHIDIAHYEKLTDSEVKSIEDYANNLLFNGIIVTVKEMSRADAETEYGFTIYQGHGVPAKKMRIIVITDKNNNLIDAEACGGLHVVSHESSIGLIKIINTSRIHDGVDRIEFVAGEAALHEFQKEHNELISSALFMNSDYNSLNEKIVKLKNDYLSMAKTLRLKDEEIAVLISKQLLSEIKDDTDTIILERTENRDVLRKVLSYIIKERPSLTILAKNIDNEVVCFSGQNSKYTALEFAKKTYGENFKGGGSKISAEGVLK